MKPYIKDGTRASSPPKLRNCNAQSLVTQFTFMLYFKAEREPECYFAIHLKLNQWPTGAGKRLNAVCQFANYVKMLTTSLAKHFCVRRTVSSLLKKNPGQLKTNSKIPSKNPGHNSAGSSGSRDLTNKIKSSGDYGNCSTVIWLWKLAGFAALLSTGPLKWPYCICWAWSES